MNLRLCIISILESSEPLNSDLCFKPTENARKSNYEHNLNRYKIRPWIHYGWHVTRKLLVLWDSCLEDCWPHSLFFACVPAFISMFSSWLSPCLCFFILFFDFFSIGFWKHNTLRWHPHVSSSKNTLNLLIFTRGWPILDFAENNE